MSVGGTGKRIIRDVSLNNFSIPNDFMLQGGLERLFVSKKGSFLSPKTDMTVTPQGLEIVNGKTRSYYSRDSIKQIYYRGRCELRDTGIGL